MNQLKQVGGVILGIVLIALILFTIYINYDNVVGAFGSGPPYYSQTTNMDKWRNPIPFLVLIDIVVIAVSVIGFKWIVNSRK